MPGIVGFITRGRGIAQSRETLERMRDLLREPSTIPTDQLFCDENMCCTRTHAGITNRTDQPYVADDIHIWLDGEIYESGNLRHWLPGESDAKLLATLYKEAGNFDFLRHVNGIFTAVLYDRSGGRIHLISDRYGLRHLYYYTERQEFVWASEIKAFLGLPEFSPVIDRIALDDFVDLGHMIEDRTWFTNVKLVPSASVLTWDLHTRRCSSLRYWWWDAIKMWSGPVDIDEVAEELGDRFIRAVARRSDPGHRVGVQLSGGLDSRAILAAMPERDKPISVLTFGRRGSADRKIAQRVAAVRPTVHHTFELNQHNWLPPRFRGVWLTDGQLNLMHMHGVEAVDLMRQFFDVYLGGFAGDLIIGGSFLRDASWCDRPIDAEAVAKSQGRNSSKIAIGPEYVSLPKTDFYFLQNRIRRFTYAGQMLYFGVVHTRKPFLDNDFLELAYSLPDEFRLNSRIYRSMLLRKFPAFFHKIPWKKTGLPISAGPMVEKTSAIARRGRGRLGSIARRLLQRPSVDRSKFTAYKSWLRQEPARSLFDHIFNNPRALYGEYLSTNSVLTDWQAHLAGGNVADRLCRVATLEIWLQQVFEQNFRGDP